MYTPEFKKDPDKWHKRYMSMAKMVSTWSKDPGTGIGAIVVGDHGQILATGYNGFPRKIEDDISKLVDRETKLKYTIHAEMNCIFNASLTGISLAGSTIYVYGLPTCCDCAKGIIQAGITRVVNNQDDINKSDDWKKSFSTSKDMFEEAGVEVIILEDTV